MKLRCHRAFGNKKQGDEVEVPDGAGFDHYYFEAVPAPAPAPAPVKPSAPKADAEEDSK